MSSSINGSIPYRHNNVYVSSPGDWHHILADRHPYKPFSLGPEYVGKTLVSHDGSNRTTNMSSGSYYDHIARDNYASSVLFEGQFNDIIRFGLDNDRLAYNQFDVKINAGLGDDVFNVDSFAQGEISNHTYILDGGEGKNTANVNGQFKLAGNLDGTISLVDQARNNRIELSNVQTVFLNGKEIVPRGWGDPHPLPPGDPEYPPPLPGPVPEPHPSPEPEPGPKPPKEPIPKPPQPPPPGIPPELPPEAYLNSGQVATNFLLNNFEKLDLDKSGFLNDREIRQARTAYNESFGNRLGRPLADFEGIAAKNHELIFASAYDPGRGAWFGLSTADLKSMKSELDNGKDLYKLADESRNKGAGLMGWDNLAPEFERYVGEERTRQALGWLGDEENFTRLNTKGTTLSEAEIRAAFTESSDMAGALGSIADRVDTFIFATPTDPGAGGWWGLSRGDLNNLRSRVSHRHSVDHIAFDIRQEVSKARGIGVNPEDIKAYVEQNRAYAWNKE